MADPILFWDRCEVSNGNLANRPSDSGHDWLNTVVPGGVTWEAYADNIGMSSAQTSDQAVALIDATPEANASVKMVVNMDNVLTSNDNPFFMVARYTDVNNHYLIGGQGGSGTDSSGLGIWKCVSGTYTELDRDSTTDIVGQFDILIIDIADGNKQLDQYDWNAGAPTLETTLSTSDNALTSGGYGLAEGNFLVATDDTSSTTVAFDLIELIEYSHSQIKVFDWFFETSQTALDSHTPDVGTGWTEDLAPSSGDGIIVRGGGSKSARIETDENEQVFMSAQPNPSSVDQRLTVAVGIRETGANQADNWGLVCRYADSSNYMYGAEDETGAIRIIKVVSGSPTELAEDTGITQLSEGGVLQFECFNSGKALRRWNQVDPGMDEITSADNSIASAGKWGLGAGEMSGVTGDDCAQADLPWFVAEEFVVFQGPYPPWPRVPNTLLRM